MGDTTAKGPTGEPEGEGRMAMPVSQPMSTKVLTREHTILSSIEPKGSVRMAVTMPAPRIVQTWMGFFPFTPWMMAIP